MLPIVPSEVVSADETGSMACVMPGCRAPIPSKGKQRIGAISYGKRSVETQTAVNASPDTEKRLIPV